MKNYYIKSLFFSASFLILTSCGTTEIVQKQVPSIDLGNNIIANGNDVVELSKWWNSLGDTQLTSLIENVLAQNYDAKIALSRIEETRANLAAQRASVLPSVNYSTSITPRVQSENGAFPLASIPFIDREQVIFQHGFDSNWEADIFGAVAAAVEVQNQRLLASNEQLNAIKITLAAEVARNYFELQNAYRELENINSYVASLNQSIELINNRIRAGDLSHKDLDDLNLRKSQILGQIPAIEAKIRAANISLYVLEGKPIGPNRNLETKNPSLLNFPIGANSELLNRRPDIRMADHNLRARFSESKIYQVAKLPRFMISAHAGWEATNLGNILDLGSIAANITPKIQWNIWDNGKVEANIEAADARERQALLTYSQTIITALGDSEKAFSDYRNALNLINRRQEILAAQNEVNRHIQARYRARDISRLEVLESERAIIEINGNIIRAQSQAAIAQIALFKALGGGWSENN